MGKTEVKEAQPLAEPYRKGDFSGLFQKRYGKVKESHIDTVQESEVIEQFRAKTDELFHKIDDRTASDIEQDVLSAVKGILADYDIDAT